MQTVSMEVDKFAHEKIFIGYEEFVLRVFSEFMVQISFIFSDLFVPPSL